MPETTTTKQMMLIDHLVELQQRLFKVAVTLISAAIAGYFLHQRIIDILLKPFSGETLIYTSPAGGLEFLFKICLFFGFLVTIPVLMYHTVRFIEPVLKKQSLKAMTILMLSSIALLILGTSFAYFISLPAALHFLANFTSGLQIEALISTNEYLSFIMIYLAGFALIFQIPLLMLFINRITPFQPKKLRSMSRYVILLSFIVAAIITPTPDPLNQTLMAGPIIVLYFFGSLLVWIVNQQKAELTLADTSENGVDAGWLDRIASGTDTAGELPRSYVPESLPRSFLDETLRSHDQAHENSLAEPGYARLDGLMPADTPDSVPDKKGAIPPDDERLPAGFKMSQTTPAKGPNIKQMPQDYEQMYMLDLASEPDTLTVEKTLGPHVLDMSS